MKEFRKLLFYGVLPEFSLHGISIENSVNLKMLESLFKIDKIADKQKIFERNKVYKTILFFEDMLRIISKSLFTRYDYFYITYSLSTFGCIKSLTAIINFHLLNRGKVVLHIHRGDFFSRFYKSTINILITKFVFSLSDKIILLSENQKIEFEANFNRSFDVLTNTIELEVLPIKVNRLKSNYNFLFLSNYLIDKGIIDLLEVFTNLAARNNKLFLKMFGEFADKKLVDKIMSYSSNNININGPVTGLKKIEEIASSSCLILPSWNEGQPLVILEAMSVGTPVLASKVGLIPELLGQGYPFLFNPQDKSSLELKIVQFTEVENIFDTSDMLRKRYKEGYSHESHYLMLCKIFN